MKNVKVINYLTKLVLLIIYINGIVMIVYQKIKILKYY
jgi:hypothetical protein